MYGGSGIDLPKFNGSSSWELPVPGTFVLDRDGTVRFAFADPDYTRRAEPADVVEALRAIRETGAEGNAGRNHAQQRLRQFSFAVNRLHELHWLGALLHYRLRRALLGTALETPARNLQKFWRRL